MSLVIFVSDRTNKITCHICQQASIIIGRSQESDVQLDDASVSKAHCRVDRADGGVSVTDLGSSNGVFVNGERQGETRMIGASDLVQIMDFTLMVRALSADEALRFEAGQDPRCVAPAPLLELTRILKEKASEPSLADGLSSPLTPPREPSLNSIVNVLAPSEPAPSGRQPSSLNSIFDAVTPAPSEPAPSGRQPSSLNSIFDAVTPAPSEPAPSGRQPSSLNSIFDAVTPTPSEPAPSGRQPSSLNSIFDAVTPAPSEPAPSGRQPSSLNSILDAVTPAPSEPAPSGRQPSSLNSVFDAVTPPPSEPALSGRQPSSLNSVFDAVTPPPSEPTPSGRQPSSLNSIFDAVTPSSRSKLSSPQDKDEE